MKNELPNLYWEEVRLATFANWPFSDSCECNAQKMAEAGFYACGGPDERDLAACFMCNKNLDGWEETDDPWDEHRKHQASCPFVKLGKKQSEMTLRQFLQDVCIPFCKKTWERCQDKKLSILDEHYSGREAQIQKYLGVKK